jgi:hypothetical protein
MHRSIPGLTKSSSDKPARRGLGEESSFNLGLKVERDRHGDVSSSECLTPPTYPAAVSGVNGLAYAIQIAMLGFEPSLAARV